MNHPRHLLLLVPLALLGAALLVRARLPRPQTEGDKWLWEQAERAIALSISYRATNQREMLPFQGGEPVSSLVRITDRQGMRKVLRAFRGTPSFSRQTYALRDSYQFARDPVWIGFRFSRNDGTQDEMALFKRGKGYDLVRLGSEGDIATTTDQASVNRVWAACLAAIDKAKHQEKGYVVKTPAMLRNGS